MGLYPRMRPREDADAHVDRAEGERRAQRRDYAHDDRASPLRPSWVGRRQGTGANVLSSGTTDIGSMRTEVLRLAVVDGNSLRIVSVFSDGTAEATPGSPYAMPVLAGAARSIQGIAYASPYIYTLDDGRNEIRRFSTSTATHDASFGMTGIPGRVRGITTQRASFDPGTGGFAWWTEEGTTDGYACQSAIAQGSVSARGFLISRLNAANDEPRGITYVPSADRFYVVDDGRRIYQYTRAALTAVRRLSPRSDARTGPAATLLGFTELDSDNRDPSGIAYSIRGSSHRLHVVDTSDNKIYTYDATQPTAPHLADEDIDFTDIGITGNPNGITAYPAPAS